MQGASQAGTERAEINLSGVVTEAVALGTSIVPENIPAIIGSAIGLFTELLTLDAPMDRRDDDFWLRTRSYKLRQKYADTKVSVDIGDGNEYSLGEVSIWSFSFPS
ncbi:MAG: hypothetical protein GWP06_11965 [Actinobacteria bacterium]|nr:hypothetical protein [Actinomycetota bacterium]